MTPWPLLDFIGLLVAICVVLGWIGYLVSRIALVVVRDQYDLKPPAHIDASASSSVVTRAAEDYRRQIRRVK